MSPSTNTKLHLKRADRRWANKVVLIAATGPSFTLDVARQCIAAAHIPKLAVNDAYKVLSGPDVIYAADARWWSANRDTTYLSGTTELWTTHDERSNDKRELMQFIPSMNLIAGQSKRGYSTDPAMLHYGHNSGYQAINLALLFGATKIILVGFNMQRVNDKAHFFGEHPFPFVNTATYGFTRFLQAFDDAVDTIPAGVDIVNCTPDSALTCFRQSTLEAELV